MPPDTVFKSWTMICRMAPQAQGDTTAPVPYCRIYHRVRVQDDPNKALLIATARYQGPDKTPMLVLTLPAIANLQRGVTFQVDQSQIYKANIQVCTAQSCVSEFKLTDDLMKLFRGGSQASFYLRHQPPGRGQARRASRRVRRRHGRPAEDGPLRGMARSSFLPGPGGGPRPRFGRGGAGMAQTGTGARALSQPGLQILGPGLPDSQDRIQRRHQGLLHSS